MEVSYGELEMFLREQIGRVFETCNMATCPVAEFVRSVRPDCAVTVSAERTRLIIYDAAKPEIESEDNPRWLRSFIRAVDRTACQFEAAYETERRGPAPITAVKCLEILEIYRPE